MEATTTPSSDLLRARAAHMDNLMQQVYAIDEQLGAAKGPRKVWGAA